MKTLTFTGLAIAALTAGTAQAATVKMECGISGSDRKYCEYISERFNTETGHTLEFVELPNSSTEKLALFQQVFSSGQSGVVDVFQADVVWPGILARHMLDLSTHLSDLEDEFFSAPWQNNLIDGELKAIPSFIDTGMLLYRADLLDHYGEAPPKTWDELTRIATRIQQAEREAGNSRFWGLVFQGKAYEGLTCNALEWVASHGGGTVVDADGNITINNSSAAQGLDMAASWVGTISPRGVMGYEEEESRAVFQNGDALFMRNWPYAYALANEDGSPIQGKVGIMPLPSAEEGGLHAATLGGWQWAVSSATTEPDAAIALIRMLSERETQVQRFLLTGVTPSRPDAYLDPRVLEQAPAMADLLPIFSTAIARPATSTGAQYARVSNAFSNAAFAVLNGDMDGTQAVADLESRLARIKRNAW